MVNRITLPVEKTEVLTLFPTFVWRTQLKAQDYEVIDRKIKQKLKELTAGNLKLEPGEKWQTDQCLHEFDEFQKLNAYVYTAANSIFDFVKIVYDDVLTTGCWANISAIRTWHREHRDKDFQSLPAMVFVRVRHGFPSLSAWGHA